MLEQLELIEPTIALRDSYSSLVREFIANGENLVPFVLGFPDDDFEGLLRTLQNHAQGIGIPDGFVAHSSYWLVRNDQEIVGVSNLRHQLTPALEQEGGHIGYGIRPSARRRGYATELLAQTLKAAQRRGLTKVLMTCGQGNIGSVQAILRNGGRLTSEAYFPERNEVVQRYWISVGAKPSP
jgi:predicted acetyltransferase